MSSQTSSVASTPAVLAAAAYRVESSRRISASPTWIRISGRPRMSVHGEMATAAAGIGSQASRSATSVERQAAAGGTASDRDLACFGAAGKQPAIIGERVIEGGWERMLGRQSVVDIEYSCLCRV